MAMSCECKWTDTTTSEDIAKLRRRLQCFKCGKWKMEPIEMKEDSAVDASRKDKWIPVENIWYDKIMERIDKFEQSAIEIANDAPYNLGKHEAKVQIQRIQAALQIVQMFGGKQLPPQHADYGLYAAAKIFLVEQLKVVKE